MSISAGNVQPLAVDVMCTDDALRVALADGRAISVPLDWFPRLEYASQKELKNWRLIGGGLGIRWESLDADVSVENLLRLRQTLLSPAFTLTFFRHVDVAYFLRQFSYTIAGHTMKKFLTAEWRDLIMANYEVDPALLASRVPAGTELDLHEGKCFVSLVGFMFLDTRVLEFLVPFHVNFEEVNLRFYVKRETGDEVRRGVVFVKEIVPKAAIAMVARTLYGEPYERWHMSHSRDALHVSYSWEKGNCDNSISVESGRNNGVPDEGSHEEFIIEHYWGYTKRGDKRTDEYKVEHPKWELFEAGNPQIIVDFGCTYGKEFEFLNDRKPYSVVLAKGSEIAVYKGKTIHL